MPISRQKKEEIVTQVSDLLSHSKMTVMAKYTGSSVSNMQQLRKAGKQERTDVKVLKNRLVIKALKSDPKFKDIDTSALKDQLVYAFNAEDELAAAKLFADQAKQSGIPLEFVGALAHDGKFIPKEEVSELAKLPGKDVLRAQLVGTLKAPLSGFVSIVSGNLRGLVGVLNARAESIK